jgi:hypothetical protein
VCVCVRARLHACDVPWLSRAHAPEAPRTVDTRSPEQIRNQQFASMLFGLGSAVLLYLLVA